MYHIIFPQLKLFKLNNQLRNNNNKLFVFSICNITINNNNNAPPPQGFVIIGHFLLNPPSPFIMQTFAKVTFWETPHPLRRMTSFMYSPWVMWLLWGLCHLAWYRLAAYPAKGEAFYPAVGCAWPEHGVRNDSGKSRCSLYLLIPNVLHKFRTF